MLMTMPEENKPKTTKSKKGIYLVIAVVGFVAFFLGSVIGFVAGVSFTENGDNQVLPTTTPNVTASPTNVTGEQPSATPELEPTQDWLDYIFADCEISLKAPPEWTPGLRGESGTCGSFKIPSNGEISNINGLELGMVFVPFLSEDSPFSPQQLSKYSNVETYLKNIDTEDKREGRDQLLEQEQRLVNGKDVTYALINTDRYGQLNYLFYEVADKEFMMIWHTSDEAKYQVEIETLFGSIKFL